MDTLEKENLKQSLGEVKEGKEEERKNILC